MNWRTHLPWVVALAVIGGCSSGTSSEPTTSASLAPTTVAVTQPATTTPPTPAPTTAAPTSSTVPPTTVNEAALAEFRAAVETDFREGQRLYELALNEPSNQEARNAALAYTADGVRTAYDTYFTQLAELNRHTIPSEKIAPALVITGGPEPGDDPATEATLVYCEVTSSILVDDRSDGTYVVVDDSYSTKTWEADLVWNGEVWQLSELTPLSRERGVADCPE